jgi:hypothetical protein
VNIQISQQHLLKKLSSLQCMFLVPLSKISWQNEFILHEFILEFLILFHWPKCLRFISIMCFCPYSLAVIQYIYRFAYVKLSLHVCNDSTLIMVYDLFDVLLNLFSWYFVENFCICAQGYSCTVSFFLCSCLILVLVTGNDVLRMSLERSPLFLFFQMVPKPLMLLLI